MLERQRLARQQREGLAPSDDNRRRTFGELMNLWHERSGSRLRSHTIKLSLEKHLRPALGKLLLGGAASALPALLNSKIRQTLTVEPEPSARVLPSAVRGCFDAFGRLVDGTKHRNG